MAISAIKYVVNLSSQPMSFLNRESGETTGGLVNPNQGASLNTWIPWCGNQHDFNRGHYIQVTLENLGGGPNTVYAIWQQAKNDGDYVRFTRWDQDAIFDIGAPPIPSTDNGEVAGGDKILFVHDIRLSLEVLGAQPAFAAGHVEYFRGFQLKNDAESEKPNPQSSKPTDG